MSNRTPDQIFAQSPIDSGHAKPIKASRYEGQVVHPATAKWLTEHGYTFRHEVTIADYERADFVAIHESGHVLIVECKNSCTNFSSTIRQVKSYQSQYSASATSAIAIPQEAITDHARRTCARFSITLIELNIPSLRPERYVSRALEETIQFLLANRDKWGDLREEIAFLILNIDTPAAREWGMELMRKLSRKIPVSTNDLEAVIEAAIEEYQSQGKSDRWICSLFLSIEPYDLFMAAFQQSLRDTLQPRQFAEITDTMRIALWRRTTQQLRDEMGLDSDANLRDYETETALIYEMLAENLSEVDLRRRQGLELDEAKQIVRSDSEFVGKQAKAAGQRLGIDLVTGKPLLPAKTKR